MHKLPELSEKEKVLLVGLAELVDFTKDRLLDHEIRKNKLNVKQTILLAMFAPINCYTEAVHDLAKASRPDGAKVILRSIVEGWINSMYILGHPNDKAAYLFTIEDSYYRRGIAIDTESFYSRFPGQRSTLIPRSKLRELLVLVDGELETFRKKFGICYKNKKEFKKRWGSLKDRARWVDERLKKKQGNNAGGFEHTYLMVYRYFSEFAHLSMRGLEHFRKKDDQGEEWMILDKNPDSIDMVLATTYTIYLHFAERLKQRKLINGSLTKFQSFFKEKVHFT